VCLLLAVSPGVIYTGHQTLLDGVNFTFGHANCGQGCTSGCRAHTGKTGLGWDDRRECRSGSRGVDGHLSATVAIERIVLLAVCVCVKPRATQVFISALIRCKGGNFYQLIGADYS